MKRTVKISVVVPVYNIENYLQECLDSVVNQTLQDIEIICVDDGSTDGSSAILREYAKNDDRIVIIRQKNKGLSGARNTGIRSAKGKYIYFIDSDDMLKQPEALTELYNFAERNNTDVLFFDSDVIYEDEEAYENRKHITENYYIRTHDYSEVTSGASLFTSFMQNNEYRCMACMYLTKTEHINKNNLRFAEGMLHEDDLFTFLCLMQAEKAAHLSRNFYLRRVRGGSIMTGKQGFQHFYGYLIDYINIKSFTAKHEYPQDTMPQIHNYLEGIRNALISLCSDSDSAEEWYKLLGRKERLQARQIPGLPGSKAFQTKSLHTAFATLNHKNLPALLLTVIIMFISVYMVYWGTQKQEFHQDEMFSLMNIRGGALDRPYYYDEFFNTWYTAQELKSSIGVTAENAFSAVFGSRNLYWNLLHIAYSFTPDNFSAWPGIILNIIILAGSLIVIYLISMLFIENRFLALLPCLLWGLSSAAVNLVLYIRFYCFKTLICLLLTYVVLLAVKNGFNKWIYPAAIALLMFIGAFIHQYFLVFAFFLTAVVCVCLLIKKQYKPLIIFSVIMAAGAAAYEVLTAGGISGILTDEGNRGEEAIESLLRGGEGYPGRIRAYLDVISKAVFGGINIYIISASCILLAAVMWMNTSYRKSTDISSKPQITRFIPAAICLCYMLMIARIAPYQEFRYISCITPIIFILFISLLIDALKAAGFNRTLPAGLVIATVFSILFVFNISSLIPNVELDRYNEELDAYHHLPVVCISNEDWEVSRCYWQLLEFEDEVLIATTDDVDYTVINDYSFEDGVILILLDIYGQFEIAVFLEETGLTDYTHITTLMRHEVYYVQ